MTRKTGRLKPSIVGSTPVKTMPNAANASPPSAATGSSSRLSGQRSSPNGASAAIIAAAVISDARRAPEDLAGHDLLQRQRRREDAVEGLLVVHAHERGVGRLEERGVHHPGADDAGREVLQVGELRAVPGERADQPAEAEPEGRDVEQRLEQRRQKADQPGLASRRRRRAARPASSGR